MMDYSDIIGILLFAIIMVGVNIIGNVLIKNTILVVLICTFLAPSIFIITIALLNGYIDPFFPIVFAGTSMLSLMGSALIGALFTLKRKK